MPNRPLLLPLAALVLAAVTAVGCGGGDAEPPPQPVGPPPAGPDTTAPTLQIASNVSAPTATGPVTFSFVFSEDVGTSFDVSDITVEGGTAGAFTRVGGTQATLVVTPPTGTGTITVGVAAGRFTDLAGNANAAAAQATKDYAVSGGGGGTPNPVVFSSGFAGGNRTVEGGAYFSYSGSDQDGFNCTGGPAWCGSGDGGSGDTSFFFAYYQTPSPATGLYNGISVLAPGVTSISATGDTPGVQLSGQTTVNFTFNNNPEWQGSGTNNFGVLLTLGTFYDLDAGAGVQPCNVKLLAVVAPQNGGAATPYAVPLSAFQVIQGCNTGIGTVAAALASGPVSEVAFQATGGTAALPAVGGQSVGANLSVADGNGFYPTTLALTGGISFRP